MSNKVEVVDISTWSATGDAGDLDVTRAVDRVCRQGGFVLVSGHGVDASLIDAMDAVTREFFHRPEEEKRRAMSLVPGATRGFRPSGTALAKSLGVDTPPDLVEAFSVNNPAHSTLSDETKTVFASSYVNNVWPEVPATFRQTWEAYYDALERLSYTMLQILALALEMPTDWFDDKFDHHFCGLLANYYPPQRGAPLPGQLRRGAHSDYGAFTVLYQDDAEGGLEILDDGGVWSPVRCVPGTFVVNIGDLMSAWTNDRWVSPVHRVVNPPPEQANTERLSIPFFANPNLDALVECIASCLDPGEAPRHPAVHAGEWVLGKIHKTIAAST